MAQPHRHNINKLITAEIVLGVCCLVCGCAIYLLFRSKSLNIYQWCDAIGMTSFIDALRNCVQRWYVADFVKFCLPDGLYSAAYILFMDAIWHNDSGILKYFVISFVPCVAIGSELLQYFGLVKGTFDIYDLVCYSVPLILYYIINNKHK